MCRRTDDGKLVLLMPYMSFTEHERKQIPEEYLQCVSPATVDDINRSLKKVAGDVRGVEVYFHHERGSVRKILAE